MAGGGCAARGGCAPGISPIACRARRLPPRLWRFRAASSSLHDGRRPSAHSAADWGRSRRRTDGDRRRALGAKILRAPRPRRLSADRGRDDEKLQTARASPVSSGRGEGRRPALRSDSGAHPPSDRPRATPIRQAAGAPRGRRARCSPARSAAPSRSADRRHAAPACVQLRRGRALPHRMRSRQRSLDRLGWS